MIGTFFPNQLGNERKRVDSVTYKEWHKMESRIAKMLDPDLWTQESFKLAKKHAYAPPIRTDKTAVELTRDYETNARNVARSQAAFAASRMANLLNRLLK
jgi:hypothetical protein